MSLFLVSVTRSPAQPSPAEAKAWPSVAVEAAYLALHAVHMPPSAGMMQPWQSLRYAYTSSDGFSGLQGPSPPVTALSSTTSGPPL